MVHHIGGVRFLCLGANSPAPPFSFPLLTSDPFFEHWFFAPGIDGPSRLHPMLPGKQAVVGSPKRCSPHLDATHGANSPLSLRNQSCLLSPQAGKKRPRPCTESMAKGPANHFGSGTPVGGQGPIRGGGGMVMMMRRGGRGAMAAPAPLVR